MPESAQPDLWACPPQPCDTERMASQLQRVRALMSDGRWRTLAEIARASRASEAGASARLRDLRKFPCHLTVERRLLRPGLYAYRVRT